MWHPCPECAKCLTPGHFVWPFCLYPLSDVPRGHAAWPVCIVSRQQNLDEMEPHDGKQVEEKQRGPVCPGQCPDADLGGLDLIPLLRGGPSSYTSATFLIQGQSGLVGQARSLVRSPRGPPPGSRSHPACATCMTYGRWYEPNHRYLNSPYTCTWVLYDYFSYYSLKVILCSCALQNFSPAYTYTLNR